MNNSVIEHRACYYYVPLREEYLCLCKGDHCQALILAVLEEWMNTKRGKGQSLYTYMTYPQWVNALYGLYGRNLIILALNALEKEELISKRAYRLRGKDTFEYILNTEEMNKRIKELPEKTPHETLPNVNAFKNKRVQKSTRLQEDGNGVEKSTAEGQDAFKKGRIIESLTEITYNTDYEREYPPTSQTPNDVSPGAPAQVTTPSHALSLASLQEALTQLSEQERSVLLAQYRLPVHAQTKAHDAHAPDNVASAPNLGGVVRCSSEPESESEPPDTVSKARRSGVVATRLPPALRDLSETQNAQESAPTHIPVATETATSIQRVSAASQSDTAFSLPGGTSWVPGACQAVQKDEQTGQTAAMPQGALPHPPAERQTGTRSSQPQPQSHSQRATKPEAPLETPLAEPDMTGAWDDENVVQYAEWCNGKRYTPKMREAQITAARLLHKQDRDLTAEQFKQAYDERNDAWWREHKRTLGVTDMKAKEQSSGVIRLYAMLERSDARKRKAQLRVVPGSSASTGTQPSPSRPLLGVTQQWLEANRKLV